jgi:hypothetical protein
MDRRLFNSAVSTSVVIERRMMASVVNRWLRPMTMEMTGNQAAETDSAVLSRHPPWRTEETHEQTRDRVSRTAHLMNVGQELFDRFHGLDI